MPTPKPSRYALIKQDPEKLAKLNEYNKARYLAMKNAGMKQKLVPSEDRKRYNAKYYTVPKEQLAITRKERRKEPAATLDNSKAIIDEPKPTLVLVFYRSCIIENKDIMIYHNTENKKTRWKDFILPKIKIYYIDGSS